MTESREDSCAEFVRVGFGPLAGAPDCRPIFSNTVTLDPHGAEEAWTKLSTFTPAVELHDLQWRMHVALVKAIARSSILKKMKASEINLGDRADQTLGKLRSAGL